MDFFSIPNEELSSPAEEYDFNKPKAAHQEEGLTAEEGLQKVNALLQNLAHQSWIGSIGSKRSCENLQTF